MILRNRFREQGGGMLRRARRLPKPWRRALGGGLVLGGVLGFLPVVGFWMLPFGLVVLSEDSPRLRRLRRRGLLWWGRRAR